MLKTGLVSITFRDLDAKTIIDLVKEAGLDGIEWGSDIHVPAGDIVKAKQVKEWMDEAGLKSIAYGSYYRVGENKNPKEDFLPYLESAIHLGVPSIRVWAGTKGSLAADDAYIKLVVEDTKIICDMALEHGIQIAYEYHPNTLTDERHSALRTLKLVDHENLVLYWQPNYTLDLEENLAALKMVSPYLKDVHVFYWLPDYSRKPLLEGQDVWMKYIATLKESQKEHALMLEFVEDGKPEQFLTDAKALLQYLS